MTSAVAPSIAPKLLAPRIKDIACPTKLLVLGLIADGRPTVGEIALAMGFSQSATSHILLGLKLSGVVEREREGKTVYHALTDRGRRLMDAVDRLGAMRL